jgi:hypothetical protein
MESEMIFDRTAGGHRFDYSRGFCVLCGIAREEFKDNDYPKCAGELYGQRERLPALAAIADERIKGNTVLVMPQISGRHSCHLNPSLTLSAAPSPSNSD